MGKVISIILSMILATTFFYGSGDILTKAEVEIKEWKVPWKDSRPRDPYVAPDGDIWFVGQRTHYIAEFDPETEEFRKFDLEDGAGPHTVVLDASGTPWYTGNTANHIGKLDPETGKITKYMMPDDKSARDPHTMAFNKNGNIWFTSQGANSIGFFDVQSEEEYIISVPTPRARPYGIIMDMDMVTPWIVLFGTNKLATVSAETMELTEIELPNEGSRPRRLAQTSDGVIWYGDYSRGYIGSYNPDNGKNNEWKLPSGERSRPYAVTVDDKDRVWLVETGVQPNMFVGFDTNSKEFVASEPIPSGGGTVRNMVFDETNNAIWFGTDTNYLGKAQLD
jgi:virginiamycin B lyase